MNFGEQRVPLYQLLDTNTTIRMNNYRSVTIAANMNRALCHFLFSFSSLISTMNFNFGNEHKSYVQLSVINKFSSILEYRLFLSLFISLSLSGQRLFLIRFRTLERIIVGILLSNATIFILSPILIIKNCLIVTEKEKKKSNREIFISRDPSFSADHRVEHAYFANHPIGQNHYSGRGNENIQTTRSPLRMPAVNRRRLPRNRRRGRFFVASITLYRRPARCGCPPLRETPTSAASRHDTNIN